MQTRRDGPVWPSGHEHLLASSVCAPRASRHNDLRLTGGAPKSARRRCAFIMDNFSLPELWTPRASDTGYWPYPTQGEASRGLGKMYGRPGLHKQPSWREFSNASRGLVVDDSTSIASVTREGANGPVDFFCGIGLCGLDAGGQSRLSSVLPLDSLAMVLVAELARRHFGSGKLVIGVADSNAHACGHDAESTAQRADAVQTILENFCELADIPARIERLADWQIDEDALPAEVEQRLGPYAALQIAQMRHAFEAGYHCRVGWRMSNSEYDEARFSSELYRATGIREGLVGVRAGRSFELGSPRRCPYVCFDESTRIVIERGEDPAAKLAHWRRVCPATALGYRRYLLKVARLYRCLTGRGVRDASVDLLTEIIDEIALR